ncbi:MAG: glycosyltransferase [Sandaracinaceae bacterium]
MRIGVLTTGYPRFDGDVAGLFVRGMARALAARGHALEVLAPAPRKPTAPLGDASITVRHVAYAPPVLRKTFYGAGVPDNLRHPLAWPGLAAFPVALVAEARRRATDWDAVLSHWALPSALVGGLVRGDRPHLAVLHSADVHLLGRLPGRARWVDAVARASTELLFASAAHRASFLDALPPTRRATVAGHAHASAMGIDPLPETEDRRALRRRLGLDRFTVLFLGRLVPIKGLAVAIDALRGLDDVELVVAGDGPLRGLAKEGVGRFVGHVDAVRKAELLRAADALVLPSTPLASGRTEGTPTVALEAGSAGLPIIASEVGGLPELFAHDRSALFVPPRDPGAIRDAVERLRGDRKLRRRLARAAGTVAKHHAWSELAPRIEALLSPQG